MMKMAAPDDIESYKFKNLLVWNTGSQPLTHPQGLFSPELVNWSYFLQVGEFEQQLDKQPLMLLISVLMPAWKRR